MSQQSYETAELRREMILSVVNRVCFTAFLIAWVFVVHGCYEEKRRYDIIERMQMPVDQAPRNPGKLRVPDLNE